MILLGYDSFTFRISGHQPEAPAGPWLPQRQGTRGCTILELLGMISKIMHTMTSARRPPSQQTVPLVSAYFEIILISEYNDVDTTFFRDGIPA